MPERFQTGAREHSTAGPVSDTRVARSRSESTSQFTASALNKLSSSSSSPLRHLGNDALAPPKRCQSAFKPTPKRITQNDAGVYIENDANENKVDVIRYPGRESMSVSSVSLRHREDSCLSGFIMNSQCLRSFSRFEAQRGT